MSQLRLSACLSRLLVPMLLSAGAGGCDPALAQQAAPPATSAQTPPESDESETTVSELDVVVSREYTHLPGAVPGPIKPEIEFSPAQIQALGVNTVSELLGELEFQTRAERETAGGAPPLVLLNGRRIASLNEVVNLPTEAILRVDVLPEEAALQYGSPPTQRVVNIVLKRHFHATVAGLEGGRSDSGRKTGQAEADLLHLHHNRRLNIDLKYVGATDVTDADQRIVEPPSAASYSLQGNVLSPVPGGEIDPALSALAGFPVTLAGMPKVSGAPTLADFAATAGKPTATDAAPFRSLAPASQSLAVNAVLAEPLPAGINATFNAAFNVRSSDSMRGLPGYRLLVPAGDPYSPFAGDVLVDRYADRPLHKYENGWTAHLGSVLDREKGTWRYSLTAAYDHADTQTDIDDGVDRAPLQALLDARSPAFNPFAPPPASDLVARPQRRARAISDQVNAQALISGALMKLPAGDLRVSFSVSDAQAWVSATPTDPATFPPVRLNRNDGTGQVSLDAPLSSHGRPILPFLGDLSINGNAAFHATSNVQGLRSFGYGLAWTPVSGFSVIASWADRETPPTVEQQGAATISTPGVRLYDYVTGQSVDVGQITGGSASLDFEKRRTFKLGLTMRPFSSEDLTFTVNYIKNDVRDPITVLPAVTPDFEAAFPDRFVRDPAEDLTLEDDRPLNLARLQRSEVRWGVNFSRRFGATAGTGSPLAGLPSGDNVAAGQANPRSDTDQKSRTRENRAFRTGAPAAGRVQFALYHSLYLVDHETLRPGGPVVDLLNGGPAATFSGGQYRNEVDAQLGVVFRGLGVRLTGFWRQGSTVAGGPGTPAADVRFSDLAVMNLRLFDNFSQQKSLVARHPWLRGARLSLNVTNLLNQRISVRDALGARPLAFQPGYLDPIGRTVSVNFRKVFF